MEPQSPTLDSNTESGGVPPAVPVWGLPLTPVTLEQTLDLIAQWVSEKSPRFLVTANVHYAMLCERDPELRAVNRAASMIVGDGMPLVWASHRRLPERVAGSDLVPALCCASRRARLAIVFPGRRPGHCRRCCRRAAIPPPELADRRHGIASFSTADGRGTRCVCAASASRPNRCIDPFVCHAQRREIHGGTLSHVRLSGDDPGWRDARFCGRTRTTRARWMQRIGLEWFWRFIREPRRLAGRYFRNGLFVLRMMFKRS